MTKQLILTNHDLIEIEKELCKRSLSEFVRRAWHVLEPANPYIHGWHVDAVCEHLEAITRGDLNRLLINIPPGTMKSTLVSVFWPAWEWGPMSMPAMRIISSSHSESLAVRDTLKMRRLVASDWFQERWPVRMTSDQNQKTYYENTSTGFRQASAVNSLTGKRGDRVIWDDPHNVKNANSEKEREAALETFSGTLPTRVNSPEKSAIIIVMQRLHENDVSGYILSHDLPYEHLMLPMEYDPSRACTTSIGFTDPRTYEGELLFPGRFPRHVVERDKAQMTMQFGSYHVAGQFQQSPTPRGGGIIKTHWFQYYDGIPRIKYRVIYADTAQKTKTHNDYTVFECWGYGEDGRIYLLDLIRGKYEAPELQRIAESFWIKQKNMNQIGIGTLRCMAIEDKSSGTGLIQNLKADKKLKIPVKEIPRSVDKVERGENAAPMIENGYVVLPRHAEWLPEFLQETEKFPNGAHDDQVDPMLDAIQDMLLSPQKRARIPKSYRKQA